MAKDGQGGGGGGDVVALCVSGCLSAPNFWEPVCVSALRSMGSVHRLSRVAAQGMLTACLQDGSGSIWINATSHFAG